MAQNTAFMGTGATRPPKESNVKIGEMSRGAKEVPTEEDVEEETTEEEETEEETTEEVEGEKETKEKEEEEETEDKESTETTQEVKSYECSKCGRPHRVDSKIGREHLQYAIKE